MLDLIMLKVYIEHAYTRWRGASPLPNPSRGEGHHERDRRSEPSSSRPACEAPAPAPRRKDRRKWRRAVVLRDRSILERTRHKSLQVTLDIHGQRPPKGR